MSTAAQEKAEVELMTLDTRARCRKEAIYGTAKKPAGYVGRRRAPVATHEDERGAVAVIETLDQRFVFRADAKNAEWFLVEILPLRPA